MIAIYFRHWNLFVSGSCINIVLFAHRYSFFSKGNTTSSSMKHGMVYV